MRDSRGFEAHSKGTPQEEEAVMHETRNVLSESVRTEMVELLNARLADAIDLRQQVKVAHWNVKGPNFIALHKLFDDIVEDVDEYVDVLAERVVQLGGLADGTVRQAAKRRVEWAPRP